MKKLVVALGLFLAVTGWGIGRSGNGTVGSSRTGFQAETPADFGISQDVAGDRVRLISTIVDVRPEMQGISFIEIADADRMLPEFSALDRGETANRARELGWTALAGKDPCVEAYLRQDKDGDLLAAFWGPGKGVVLIGPHSPYVRIGENEFLRTLRLDPGACAW